MKVIGVTGMPGLVKRGFRVAEKLGMRSSKDGRCDRKKPSKVRSGIVAVQLGRIW